MTSTLSRQYRSFEIAVRFVLADHFLTVGIESIVDHCSTLDSRLVIGTYQADTPADQKEKLRFWINILLKK
jgi:hypothetical protein